MGFPIKNLNLYKIGLYEIIILFIVLFFTYTMPLTVYKFTSSFLGKFISLLSIIYACYYNIAYGLVLAVLFIGISEIGYLEGFTDSNKKTVVPSAKEAFLKTNCSANKTKFRLDTIDKDYPNIEFTEGACEPCDPTCRYIITNQAETLYNFDRKIKPTDSSYVENFEGSIHSDLKNINNKKNKLNASMITEGLTSNIVDKAKVAFLKTNCSANKTKFRLDTIDKDYPGLEFTDGVCEPCDPTCRYIINNQAETLYDFDRKIKPTDSIYIENFESAILSDLKGKYKKNKRKAAMIKDGFTSKVVDTVTHYARKYNL